MWIFGMVYEICTGEADFFLLITPLKKELLLFYAYGTDCKKHSFYLLWEWQAPLESLLVLSQELFIYSNYLEDSGENLD